MSVNSYKNKKSALIIFAVMAFAPIANAIPQIEHWQTANGK